MEPEGQFVRGAAERSSRTRLQQPSSLSVEIARQRALQAAEYYHRTVLSGGSESGSPPADFDDLDDQYFTRSNGAVPNSGGPKEALRAGVTPASSDTYYKAKLRAGFIDLRNSYNEKIKSRANTYSRNFSNVQEGSRRDLGRVHESAPLPQTGPSSQRQRSPAERRGLYRSNSSLELDSVDYQDEGPPVGPLHREYGSTNSLDVISTSGDSFFAMLQDFRNENLDQRAPPPPQMREVLRGRPVDVPPPPLKHSLSSPEGKVSNGSVPQSHEEDQLDGSQSPHLKPKSQKSKDRKPRAKSMAGETGGGGGIFRKLRGGKSDSGDSSGKSQDSQDGDGKQEDRQKRKALVHYDCQSLGLTLTDLIKRRNSFIQRRNTTTGASAASGVRNNASPDVDPSDDGDIGDGRSNDLVLSCPFFRNELGGEEERTICLNRYTARKRVQQLLGNHPVDSASLVRHPVCNGVAVLDTTPSPHGIVEPAVTMYKGYVYEHVDQGAFYYRNFFHGYEVTNIFGIDETLGPVAISLKREKVDERDSPNNSKPESPGYSPLYQYRIIVRTSELPTIRGCLLEDAIPSSSRLSSTRGLPPKDVLEYVVPELQPSCLRLAQPGPKTSEELLKLDEQGIFKRYKFGIMYCRTGQSSEEEMYNNENAGPAFEEFLNLIGQRVRLKNFDKYKAGLDSKMDSTGTHSLFTTYGNYEVMFHVSTMLPYTPTNHQQLLRKRHIGNDIVTIVFQEPGALAFTPKAVRSHFQHVFIIVRVHSPNTDHTKYSVAVSRSKDVPPFGPPISHGATFPRSQEFADFLLAKAINAENAAHKSDKFTAMATRTKQEYLKDLATNFVTTTTVDSGSKLSKFSLGSGRKKDKSKTRLVPDILAKGAVVWNVQVEDFGGQSSSINCYLGIAMETIVLVEERSREVVFTVPSKAVIGWTSQANSLRIYYDHGECIALKTHNPDPDEVQEVTSRLAVVSQGCETVEMTLRRNGLGQLGFHVHYEGIVYEVEPYGFAWQAGLRQGSRLVEICKVATVTLTHDQMIDLLRTSVQVKVIVIPPMEDGSPRSSTVFPPYHRSQGGEDARSSHLSSPPHSLTSHNHQRNLREDDELSNASTRSTVVSVRSHSKHSSLRVDPKLSIPRSNHSITSSNYSDMHGITMNLEPRFDQAAYHGKQESHDSAGSKSSGHGSLEGQGSETQTLRTDNISEGFISGDDRHSRNNPRDNSEIPGSKEWSGKVTIYPAYSQVYDQESFSPSSPKQVVIGAERWQSAESDQHGNNYTGSGSAYLSRSAFRDGTSGHKTVSNNILPQLSYNYQGKVSPAHSEGATAGSTGQAPIVSMSNLSDLSSHSHSSGSLTYRHHDHGQGHKSRSHDNPHMEQGKESPSPGEPRGGNMSPAGRRRQAAFLTAGSRRSYLESSPHGSNSSSPRASNRWQSSFDVFGSSSPRHDGPPHPHHDGPTLYVSRAAPHIYPRNLSGVSSEENLSSSGRLRSGLAGSHQRLATAKSAPHSNFQEELMRLIDPDVSLTDLESTFSRDHRRRSGGRLQRTLSDESMCSTQPAHNRARGHAGVESIGKDVLFSTAVPQKSSRQAILTKEQRLSPRATSDLPGSMLRGGGGSQGAAHTASSPLIPLPDAASGLDWSNLVDAANKAFQGGAEKSASMAAIADMSESAEARQVGMKSSKSSDLHGGKHSRTGHGERLDRHGMSPASRGIPVGYPWRSVGSGASGTMPTTLAAATQRIQELEALAARLQQEIEKERAEHAATQNQVQQLRQDNIRLQEESQTAAAQLRKFTEWFFNTIDRQ